MRSPCEVLILGAGMSGLCTAIQLKKAGLHDVVMVERSAGVGGTWWDNRYPGAHVDVPAPLYSFSFAPNPQWSRRFASSGEIRAYMQRLFDEHGLASQARFGTSITALRFDETSGRWQADCDRGPGWSARFVVLSTGPLSVPRWPEIEGLDRFAGAKLHSARWDDAVSLAGRRVAVIGTGSTASQLVAPIAAQAASLVVFQRTANWVMPRIDRRYGRLDRLLARVPPYAAAVRAFWYGLLEWGRRGFEDGSVARRGLLRTAKAHLQHQVRDPALRAKLAPAHALGCKRIIYSNDFYPALAQPNVELVTAAIERIEADRVITAGGREHPVDVLVCATGFDVQHSIALPVTGRGGTSLREAWAEGPRARYGMTVAGFPNLFLMLGPNTATGHTSTLLFIEPAVRFAIRAMQEVRRRGCRFIDTSGDAQRRFDDEMQTRLAGSVWSGCRSWYRADNGRIIAIWPGFTREYVERVARQGFGDFEFG